MANNKYSSSYRYHATLRIAVHMRSFAVRCVNHSQSVNYQGDCRCYIIFVECKQLNYVQYVNNIPSNIVSYYIGHVKCYLLTYFNVSKKDARPLSSFGCYFIIRHHPYPRPRKTYTELSGAVHSQRVVCETAFLLRINQRVFLSITA